MRRIGTLALLVLLGPLGAAPPSSTLKEQTDKIEKIRRSYLDLAKRMDAAISDLRDMRAAFPTSPDPEGLIKRWRARNVEANALWGEQWDLRKDYRKNLRALYVYHGTRFLIDVNQGKGPSASDGGNVYAAEKTVVEMGANSERYYEDLKNEAAGFQSLAQEFAARKDSRRRALIAGAFLLGAAALTVGLLLKRRRTKAFPAPAPAALAAPPQKTAPAFELRGLVGRGTMGEVHEAFDPKPGRRLALKILRPELLANQAALERLLSAARAISALSHPNIAALHSIESAGAQIYLAFEFVEGKSIQGLLQERGRLDTHTSLLILRGTGAALQHAHGAGVIHRDLKPANIMLTHAGEVKVLDFAVAHEARKSLSGQSWAGAGGTPPYMAPEQEQGKVSPAVDLYALSVVFYEMLTGDLPFKGPNFLAQKKEALHLPPSKLAADLPPGLDAFFKVALAPQASRRFATAEALAAAAEAAA